MENDLVDNEITPEKCEIHIMLQYCQCKYRFKKMPSGNNLNIIDNNIYRCANYVFESKIWYHL